jgi:2,4'-dihydroxyacetophenone dioxygenase
MSTAEDVAEKTVFGNQTYPRVVPPAEMAPELIVHTQDDDERMWMPVSERVWVRPLLFNPMTGIVSRHRHPTPVTGYTREGSWGYIEHDWVAGPGTFITEPAGETHTLVVHPSAGHMKVFFHAWGPFLYVDEDGNVTQYTDVFTRIRDYKDHCRKVGLGDAFVDAMIR